MEGIVWESVWVAVGFVIFVALVWKRIGNVLSTMLDDRSARIKADLDEARTLREEALDELHQFQRLHREAAEEAKAILKNAEATAKETIKRREQQATAKIRAAETAMINELREKAASLAVASAAQIITSKLDDKAGLALIDEAAGEIEKLN